MLATTLRSFWVVISVLVSKEEGLESWAEGDLSWIVVILWGEEPARIFVHQFIASENKFGEELVGVDFVDLFSAVVTSNAIFVIIIEGIALLGWSDFGMTVGLGAFFLVKDNKFGGLPIFAGPTEVAPEASAVDVVSTSVIEVPSRLGGNL